MNYELWVRLSDLGFVLVRISLVKVVSSVPQVAEVAHNISVGARSAGGAEADSVVRHSGGEDERGLMSGAGEKHRKN